MIKAVQLNSIINGDAYQVIKEIPDASIDLVVIDPPYLLGKNNHRNVECSELTKHAASLTSELHAAEITNGINFKLLDELMRTMKTPNIYIWCNKAQILDYLYYFVREKACSFEILTWIKTNPIPLCGNTYLPDKEYCLYFRKNIKLHIPYDRARTYWITQTNKVDKRLYQHPTIKPLPIIETLVLNSSKPGDTVLDCFVGSGTTAVAAAKLGRNYIGIEKNELYVKTTLARLNEIHQNH